MYHTGRSEEKRYSQAEATLNGKASGLIIKPGFR